MEWQQIVGFYQVAKLGSFTRAAEVTFRTQSALTQQVKSLEEELGDRLFERIGKRRILLTPAGEKFFAFAENVLGKYGDLLEELRELKGVQKGRLTVAAPFTTLYYLLPQVLAVYMREFPRVEVSVFDRSQQSVVELVKSGDVDFGLTLESVAPENLDKIRLGRVESVLLTPLGHPLAAMERVTVEQIARYPLILPPKGNEYSGRRRLEELFRKAGTEYRIVMESSNVELSSLYVEIGLGLSFATVIRDLPVFKQRKFALVSLGHYFPPEHMAVLLRKDKVLPAFKSAFLNMLSGA